MIFGPYFPVPYHVSPPLMSRTARNYNFTVLCKFATKNCGRNDFSHFTIFPYFFVFSTYQRALPNSTNSAAKMRKSGPQRLIFSLLFFVTFWLVSLTRWGFRIQQILRKWQKVGAATIFRSLTQTLTVAVSLFLDSLPVINNYEVS